MVYGVSTFYWDELVRVTTHTARMGLVGHDEAGFISLHGPDLPQFDEV